MTINHIVMFKFRSDTADAIVKQNITAMLALKDKCIHPTTSRPYIISSVGGRDNSPEGMQRDIQYAFIVQFESEEDRAYYLDKDPAHLSFIENVKPHVEVSQVVDFTPGQF